MMGWRTKAWGVRDLKAKTCANPSKRSVRQLVTDWWNRPETQGFGRCKAKAYPGQMRRSWRQTSTMWRKCLGMLGHYSKQWVAHQ